MFPPIGSATVVRQRSFWIPAPTPSSSQRNTSGRAGWKTAGPGCYDAVAIARAAGFRMLVMSRVRHATIVLNRSEPAKNSGQNIPKNRCRTTIAERMMETLAELPFYRGSGRLLKPRTGPPAPERDLTKRVFRRCPQRVRSRIMPDSLCSSTGFCFTETA